MAIDSPLFNKGHSLAKRFNDCGNQEIATEFDKIGLFLLFCDNKRALTYSIKNRSQTIYDIR